MISAGGCVCGPGWSYDSASGGCVPCGSVQYKSEVGNFPCFKCPENSIVLSNEGKGATSVESCVCVNRYYKNDTCVECKTGGNCTSGVLLAADGYWRPDTSFEKFVKCIPPKACRGGSPIRSNTTVNNSTSRHHHSRAVEGCNPGYNSFMCAHCDFGYAWSGSACVTCQGPNVGMIIGLVALTVFFVGYVYWTVGAASIAKLAIFVNYLQLLAQSYVIELVKFLPLAEFNWITVAESTSSCIFPFSWWGLWLFNMMIPVFLALLVFVFYALRLAYKIIHQRLRHPDRVCNVAPGKKPLPVNSAQAVMMLLLFNYLLIAKSCLSMFACVDVFGVIVVAQNYSFQCGSALHAGFIALAAVWLAVFCVLLPLLILLRIVIPDKLPKFMLVLDVEFLTVHFQPGYKWWEVIFIVRRLCFAIIVTIISIVPSLKVLVFALFSLGFLLAQSVCHPYNNVTDNALEFSGLLAIVITFSVQSYVIAYGDPNNGGLYFVTALNALVCAVMIIFLLIDAIPMIVLKLRTALTNRKRKKALRAAELAQQQKSAIELSTKSIIHDPYGSLKRNATLVDDQTSP